MRNRVGRTKSSSRFKGVSKIGKKFHVVIQKDKVNYNLGMFSDEIEAAKAYDSKAVELFGIYAFTNFTGDICNVPEEATIIETARSVEKEIKPLINSQRKLTKEQVDLAREMIKTHKKGVICKMLGISYGALKSLINFDTYKNF